MVAGKWGIQLSHRGSFGYSQNKRNACKSRKCSHDQIEKKKNCQRAQCPKKCCGLLFSEAIKN